MGNSLNPDVSTHKATRHQPVTGFTIFATLGAVMFGEFAHEISTWSVCAVGKIRNDLCGTSAEVTALMIGTIISTLVLILRITYASRLKNKSLGETNLAVSAAMLGAFFSTLKAAAKGNHYPDLSLLGTPIYIFFGTAFLFLLPSVLLRYIPVSVARHNSLVTSVTIALLSGLIVGLIVQAFGHFLDLVFTGKTEDSSGIFIVAPMATVMGGGAWGVAMLNPWLPHDSNPEYRRRLWLFIYAVGAVLLAAGYGAYYYMRHSADWIPSSISLGMFCIYACLLLLPALFLLLLLTPFYRWNTSPARLILSALLCGVLGASAAWWVISDLINLASGRPHAPGLAFQHHDLLWHVPTFALASSSVVAVVHFSIQLTQHLKDREQIHDR